jgi:hypothetical protein
MVGALGLAKKPAIQARLTVGKKCKTDRHAKY